MRGEEAANSSTSDHANSHRSISSWWLPLSGAGVLGALLLALEETPGHIGQALAFGLADTVRVLSVEADLAVLIHNLWVQREHHVLFEHHVAFGADRRVFDHGCANRMAGKMSEAESILRKCVRNRAMDVAGNFALAHELAGSF